MIKAIFFDFDGVLTTDPNGFYTTSSFFNKKFGISIDSFSRCYSIHTKDFDTEPKSFDGVWGDLSSCLGCDIDIKYLHEAFMSAPKNDKMFDLANNLKGKYKLGIITDNKKDRFEMLIKKFELNNLFESLILSADVGAEKNDRLIFDKALESFGVTAEESIFIDNTQKNIDVAKILGFKTIFFDDKINNVDKLKKQLVDLGANI
ncbi:MAG: HAD-IA family hydrolase [Candidatus Magasanikbacteria bacterium]|jgi:HAD superfamily hydrolase (TIGR01549 family)|nr:HAD-IA family hydrolase [Candidatus Magasanikbacteria bacterium]MBT4314853.1 HAD-IA family hydrolase [Candidatus Magasanikbacteria bacterium]MBT4546760.1 HAD-IA family hydrolase [Candidatus Magasanikbacteria bacterium]MBT6819631.1 HAD-IA family hydrolase [Candidatus Magasanikbacteria bacterium]